MKNEILLYLTDILTFSELRIKLGYKINIPDLKEILNDLVKNGLIIQLNNGYYITDKGRDILYPNSQADPMDCVITGPPAMAF